MPEAFDHIAEAYDAKFTFSKIGKAQRTKVHKMLARHLTIDKALNILEINCGTGEDAIFMATFNHRVLATDISEKMIAIAKNKANNPFISFQVVDINLLNKNTFDKKFDLIFSNFGGLNCLSETELEAFFKNTASLLNPYGKIIAILMPKYCVWESFYFLLKGKFKQVFRRTSKEVTPVILESDVCYTWYYNPKNITKLSKRLFKCKKTRPIGITIPPSYLENSVVTKRPWFSLLLYLEKILSFSFLSKFSDHYLIELEKR